MTGAAMELLSRWRAARFAGSAPRIASLTTPRRVSPFARVGVPTARARCAQLRIGMRPLIADGEEDELLFDEDPEDDEDDDEEEEGDE